ncbi:cyd operon YbgE family protein [Acidihalobacter prosperus]|uniref:Cyd operon protein YbgE n=1 Tax=Acidihalobacter prosperus TaxID=160660 RepID=A0A1A6C808_9GAMM|nr:cyd operon YbgE family protein [Acidihalobacter prosperus]OBS10691.1 hypothetical protein Thpro_020407 [Acidihalobacter prosperus]
MSPQTLARLSNGIALCGGAAVALLVMSYPWTIAFSGEGIREPLFALATLAAAGGFIYGLGYRPASAIFRRLITPWTIFPLILLSLGWIAYALHLGPAALSAAG